MTEVTITASIPGWLGPWARGGTVQVSDATAVEPMEAGIASGEELTDIERGEEWPK